MPSVARRREELVYEQPSLDVVPELRAQNIQVLIDGVERYNPENVPILEEYLAAQCKDGTYDCMANLALLKLYQFTPDLVKDDVLINILLKALLSFPLPDFSLCFHLLPPHTLVVPPIDNLSETVQKIDELKHLLDRAEYAKFWEVYNSDDFYVDLVADITGFEDDIRRGIGALLNVSMTKIDAKLLEDWLDVRSDLLAIWLDRFGWKLETGIVLIPLNKDNEARSVVTREDIKLQHLSRLIKHADAEEI